MVAPVVVMVKISDDDFFQDYMICDPKAMYVYTDILFSGVYTAHWTSPHSSYYWQVVVLGKCTDFG